MPDKKRTERTEKHTRALDNEIKKDLECCILGDCQGCFYGDTDQRHCKDDLMQSALDLINRQQAENKRLSTLAKLGNTRANDYRVMRDRALKAEAEIERLKKSNRNWRRKVQRLRATIDCFTDIGKMYSEIKAEAYKEFAERVKLRFSGTLSCSGGAIKRSVDNLLKELTEKTN